MELAYLQESWETDVPIDKIATHLGRSMRACRQQAHRISIKRGIGLWLR